MLLLDVIQIFDEIAKNGNDIFYDCHIFRQLLFFDLSTSLSCCRSNVLDRIC